MLHIGGDVMLPNKSVIAVLDIKKSGSFQYSREDATKIEGGKFRTLIIAEEMGERKIYLSPLTTSAICRLKKFGGN